MVHATGVTCRFTVRVDKPAEGTNLANMAPRTAANAAPSRATLMLDVMVP